MSMNLTMSIVTTVLLYIILKYFEKWRVDNLQGLFFNYVTASIFSFMFNYSENIGLLPDIKNFYYASLFIGLLFIVVFFLTAKTAQEVGIGTTSVASKMSVVIPMVAGVMLYDEPLTLQKVIGLILALISVYLTRGGKKEPDGKTHTGFILILPFILFIGAGLVDTSIKYSQATFINAQNQNLFVSTLFGSAAFFGGILIVKQMIMKEATIQIQSVLGGILLGLVNFFSLYFLIRALAEPGTDSGKLFTIVNIGIVLVSVVASFLFFKEVPQKKGIIGIVVAVIAIYIML
ncbi:MAG TPA: DMT family transporter [Bacteroidia bacterium]|nr:DMT family transporter [Bacteroidia bacterium]HNU33028.1 DMT family transporter [Bacteroidia bacterium]